MTRCSCKILGVFIVLIALVATPANAADPGWSPVIIASGEYRQRLQSTPIEMRPYRPFHFYGNTVRRRHHRSNKVATQVFKKTRQRSR